MSHQKRSAQPEVIIISIIDGKKPEKQHMHSIHPKHRRKTVSIFESFFSTLLASLLHLQKNSKAFVPFLSFESSV
jgi:hypothetical protein